MHKSKHLEGGEGEREKKKTLDYNKSDTKPGRKGLKLLQNAENVNGIYKMNEREPDLWFLYPTKMEECANVLQIGIKNAIRIPANRIQPSRKVRVVPQIKRKGFFLLAC